MKQEILNLIDKVVGKKGIMRSPAWWVNRIFKKTLDYSDSRADEAMRFVRKAVQGKENAIPTVYLNKYPDVGSELPYAKKNANRQFFQDVKNGLTTKCVLHRLDTGELILSSKVLYYPETTSGSSTTAEHVVIYCITTPAGPLGLDLSPITVFSVNILKDGTALALSSENFYNRSVVNNLESESTTAALSANQGRVLKEMVDANSARICRLPSGLQNSDKDNYYSLTGEEIKALGKATEDTLFYIVLYDEDDYEFINLPLSAGSDGSALICTGSLVRTSTLDSGATRITMTVWEFRLILGLQGYMTKTEQVIYEG